MCHLPQATAPPQSHDEWLAAMHALPEPTPRKSEAEGVGGGAGYPNACCGDHCVVS